MTASSPAPAAALPGDGPFTAFLGARRIAHGTRATVTRAARRAAAEPASSDALLVFDDRSGTPIELDLRNASGAALASPVAAAAPEAPRAAGRPKLGVVAREVTLLPAHWEWLALQPGGASVALRKLVHEARRAQGPQDAVRAAQERCYLFLRTIAGNLAGYEEALRALYRADAAGFDAASAAWPADILAYARQLAAGAFDGPATTTTTTTD